MKLSVIVPTSRVGGMDTLFACLAEQAFRDFELIVVDEIAQERTRLAAGFAAHVARAPFKVQLLWPIAGSPRWGNYMAAMNAALRASTGQRLVFLSDYSALSPGALETHARAHDEAPEVVAMCPIQYCETPKLHPAFPLRYGWSAMGHDVANHRDETYAPWLDFKRRHDLYEAWRSAYEEDLANGTLDPFMWSTFERPVTSWDDVKDLRVFNHDRRDTSPFLNLKNDSIPRSLLEKIGGFDERADGSHGHQDSITWRALEKVGAVKRSVPDNPVRLLDPHNIAIIRRLERDDESNLKLYEAAR